MQVPHEDVKQAVRLQLTSFGNAMRGVNHEFFLPPPLSLHPVLFWYTWHLVGLVIEPAHKDISLKLGTIQQQ